MDLRRVARHVFAFPGVARRAFPPASLSAIEKAIQETEREHAGQIRLAVESALDIGPLLRGQTARERAIEVFSELRVWDTEHNNGVLIYLLLADRNVEIVADRGIDARTDTQWEQICRAMEARLSKREYQDAVVEGIRAIAGHLARHFPGSTVNELPDKPVVL
ncbi:MAG TPA: TPM domain-containing protein [Burkholderiales bacterium]|nr:TPM domain-containing protein [Burkholderiales bacterium]